MKFLKKAFMEFGEIAGEKDRSANVELYSCYLEFNTAICHLMMQDYRASLLNFRRAKNSLDNQHFTFFASATEDERRSNLISLIEKYEKVVEVLCAKG